MNSQENNSQTLLWSDNLPSNITSNNELKNFLLWKLEIEKSKQEVNNLLSVWTKITRGDRFIPNEEWRICIDSIKKNIIFAIWYIVWNKDIKNRDEHIMNFENNLKNILFHISYIYYSLEERLLAIRWEEIINYLNSLRAIIIENTENIPLWIIETYLNDIDIIICNLIILRDKYI